VEYWQAKSGPAKIVRKSGTPPKDETSTESERVKTLMAQT
jgi:hypothetical protein